MEEVLKMYFAGLDEAKSFCKEQNERMKKEYDCYFSCNVWDAHSDRHFEDGVYKRWCVIADVWKKNKARRNTD